MPGLSPCRLERFSSLLFSLLSFVRIDFREVKFVFVTTTCRWLISPLLLKVPVRPMPIRFLWWSHRRSSGIGTDRWRVEVMSPRISVNKRRNTISFIRIKRSTRVTPTRVCGERISSPIECVSMMQWMRCKMNGQSTIQTFEIVSSIVSGVALQRVVPIWKWPERRIFSKPTCCWCSLDQRRSVKISEGHFIFIEQLHVISFDLRQLLSYGRRITLHELDARIDVRRRSTRHKDTSSFLCATCW